METYEATVSLSPQQAADKIRAHILNSISGECLDEARRQVADKTLIARVLKKFFTPQNIFSLPPLTAGTAAPG